MTEEPCTMEKMVPSLFFLAEAQRRGDERELIVVTIASWWRSEDLSEVRLSP